MAANKESLHGFRDSMALIDVAKYLRNDRINRLIASFREHQVSVTRTVIFGLTFLWAWYWRTGYQEVLMKDAIEVFPWAAVLFVISTVWMICLRTGWIKPPQWVDAVGVVANFIGITILMSKAFILLISLNALLPLISIAVGVRFNKRAFVASIIASAWVSWITAPAGYWVSRPAYALYAIIFTIVLPFVTNQVLNALREASAQAIISREAQGRFIATMSHELRTPLNTVINAAALIDTTLLDGDQRRLLESVTSNANALQHRVNEVLDVAAINGGRLRLMAEPFLFHDVIRTVQDVCTPQAMEKQIALSLHTDLLVTDVCIGDPGRIEQALSNLTTNAIKFTPPGGAVNVSVMKSNVSMPEQIGVVCTVQDTGIGIADADKPRVFDAFHQVSGGDARRHGGVGLGLYIVRSVSDQIGGELSIEDNPGGGTIVSWRIQLPIAQASEKVAQKLSTLLALDDHRARVESMRCLIIDDHAANRDIIGKILDRAGHHTVFAIDGPSGLEVIRTSTFDLVLLDLHMPGMSGWQVLEELGNDHNQNNMPPIVVLSADSDPLSVASAKDRGASAYLTKPIATQKLLDMLENVSANKRKPIEPTQELVSDKDRWIGDQGRVAAVGSYEATPLEEMRQIGSPDEVRRFLHSILDGIEKSMTRLKLALADNDIELATDHTHSLKNEFQSFAFHSGVDACAGVNTALRSGTDPTVSLDLLRQQVLIANALIKAEPEFSLTQQIVSTP